MVALTGQYLDEMVKAIVKAVDPEQIHLFGSLAKGEATSDSDVDLLIVERGPFGPVRSRWQELSRVRRAFFPFRLPKDILVCSAEEVEYWKDSANHVIGQCLREGKVLCARS